MRAWNVKRALSRLTLAALAFALVLWPPQRAAADDESDELEVRVRAPLDAVVCAEDQSNVTVLGLAIDTSQARLHVPGDRSGCEALSAGQTVKVRLASDIPPLVATRVDADKSGGGGASPHKVRIQAPLQAVDASAMTIVALGLTVDVSRAQIDACDEDGDDCQPIDLGDLVVGQFVQIKLDPTPLPALVATQVEVRSLSR